MLGAVVPLFFDLIAEIKETCLKIDHWMPDFTHKVDFGRSSGEVIEGDLELVLGVLVEPVPDKDNAVPN